MKILNLKQKLKDLEGNDLLEWTVGTGLANMILSSKQDPLRSYVMAVKLYSDKSMELSVSDFDFLKSNIEKAESFTNVLIPGQLLVILSELKDNKVK
jgi:hypothetical protein